MGPLQKYLNGHQFKWAPNNDIYPGVHLNGLQFKWAHNNNIDSGGPGSFDLIFTNQFKWATYNNI